MTERLGERYIHKSRLLRPPSLNSDKLKGKKVNFSAESRSNFKILRAMTLEESYCIKNFQEVRFRIELRQIDFVSLSNLSNNLFINS